MTVVEDDPELYTPTPSKIRVTKQPKHKWYDHLKSVFGVRLSRKQQIKEQEEIPEAKTSSPWILPVYVISAERDPYTKHLIPKAAKCTIDTGNLQGNIVSYDFVVDVLGMDLSTFKPLNEKEKTGAVGITANRLIPKGAVYLTWYHKNSTRVFRDMRFLVSPSSHFDLVIGAYSIQMNKILDVPNLVPRDRLKPTPFKPGSTSIPRPPKQLQKHTNT